MIGVKPSGSGSPRRPTGGRKDVLESSASTDEVFNDACSHSSRLITFSGQSEDDSLLLPGQQAETETIANRDWNEIGMRTFSQPILRRRKLFRKIKDNPQESPKEAKLGKTRLQVFKICLKYFAVLIAALYLIHISSIAVAFYQISKISPTKLKIRKIAISGLETAEGLLSAEVTFPLPYLARMFTAKLKEGSILVGHEGDEILRIGLPDISVENASDRFRLDGIKLTSEASTSVIEKFLDHFKKPSLDEHLQVKFEGRVVTRSLWFPIRASINYEHKVSFEDLWELLTKEPTSKMEPVKISSVQLDSSDMDRLRVKATLKLPFQMIPKFLDASFPELEAFASVSTSASSSAMNFHSLGKVRIPEFALRGRLIERSDEISIEAVISKESEEALRLMCVAIRDEAFDLILRLELAPSESVLSKVVSFDFKLNLEEIVQHLSKPEDDLKRMGVMQAMRLIKRGDSYSSEETSSSLLSSYTLKHNHKLPLVEVDWREFRVEDDDSAKATLFLKIRRDFLSFLTGGRFDFRRVTCDLPIIRTRVMTEYYRDGQIKMVDLGQISLGIPNCKKGSDHFEVALVVRFELSTVRALMRRGQAPSLIFRGAGKNLFDIILNEWEAGLKLSSQPALYFTRRKSRHSKVLSRAEYTDLAELISVKRVQNANLTLKTDEEGAKAVATFIADSRPAFKDLPFVRISWPELRFNVKPSFERSRMKKKFRDISLVELFIPGSSMSLSLGPSHPLNLIFDGSIQLQAILQDSGRRGQNSLTDLAQALLKPRDQRGIHHLRLCYNDSRHLFRLPLEAVINHAVVMTMSMKGSRDFIQMNEDTQVSVVGMHNARVNLKVPLPKTRKILLPQALQGNTFMISVLSPPLSALICASKKDGQNWCPVSAGIEPVKMNLIVRHGFPVAMRSRHRDIPAHDKHHRSILFGFVEIRSFTEMAGFGESVMMGEERSGLRFGDGTRPAGDKSSLLERLLNVVGSGIQVPIPLLPSHWALFNSSKRAKRKDKIRFRRDQVIEIDSVLESPSPTELTFRFKLRIPQNCIDTTKSRRDLARLFLIKWGDLTVSLASSPVGSLELAMGGGEVGVNLAEMTRPHPKNILVARSRDLQVKLSCKAAPGVTPSAIRRVVMALLYNVDWGVGLLFPAFKSRRACFKTRQCRELVENSSLFHFAHNELLQAEFQMNLKHETVCSLFGNHEQTRVLYLSRGLKLVKRLWQRFGLRFLQMGHAVRDLDIERFFAVGVELISHPGVKEGRVVSVPELLPAFGRKDYLGNVTDRNFAAAEIRVKKIFGHVARLVSRAFQHIYRLLDFPAFPLLLAYRFKCPELLLGTGLNRVDLVEVRVLPFRIKRVVNLGKPDWRKEPDQVIHVLVDFPKAMHEVAGFFDPFGLDPTFQISVQPLPEVQSKITWHSPLNVSLETGRIHSRPPNLMSVLVAGMAPDLPIFSVSRYVEPFTFGLDLISTSSDKLGLRLTGLSIWSPLPGCTLSLGDLQVVVTHERVPFAKMFFGRTRLVYGSNALTSRIVFSKSGFAMKDHPKGEAGVEAALKSLIQLGASGKPLKLELLIRINETLLLRMPFKVPERKLPGIEEMLSIDKDAIPIGEELKTVGKAIVMDLGMDVLGAALKTGVAVQKRAQTYMQSLMDWYEGKKEEASDDEDMDGEDRPETTNSSSTASEIARKEYMQVSLRSPFDWDTKVYSYKVKVGMDGTSENCPSVIPLADYLVGSVAEMTVEREDTVMVLRRNKPLVLQRGLVSGKDIPSARFLLALLSNWTSRSGFCARVELSLEVGLQLPGQDEFRLPVGVRLGHVPIPMQPGLEMCSAPLDLDAPQPCLPHDEQGDGPMSVDTLVKGNYEIKSDFDLLSAYHCSFDYVHTSTTTSLELYWSSSQTSTVLSLRPATGSAHLVREGVEEWRMASGVMPPSIPESRWMRVEAWVRPYDRSINIRVYHLEEGHVWSSFKIPVSLADHFPLHYEETVHFGLRIRTSDDHALIGRTMATPLFPEFSKSSLYHGQSQSYRVFEKGWAVLCLKDSCGVRLGRPPGGVEVMLVRVGETPSLKPWRPQPEQIEFHPLKYNGHLYGLDQRYANRPDDAIRAKFTFDAESGCHILRFVASCPGRYRVYVGYEGRRAGLKVGWAERGTGTWFLLPSHHIHIRP